MYHARRRILSAITAGTLGFGALVAQAAQPTTQPASNQELQTQVNQLKAQVQALQANQQQNQADVTAAIQSVLKDADDHSNMLAVSSGVAGYDPVKGVQITDDGGNFLVHPYLQFDARYAYDELQDFHGHPSQEGFEIRRMKFGFDGYAFSPAMTYKFQWNSADGSSPLLEDAWAKWMFSDDFGVRVGQFHDPLSHENMVDSQFSMGVDRSYLNDALIGQGSLNGGDDFVEGISAVYENEGPIRGELAFTNGDLSSNTNADDSSGAPRSNFGVAGRVEWMAMGNTWTDYDQFTSLNDKDNLLVVGIGADYTGNFGGAPFDQFLHTVDAQFDMPNGLAIYGGAIGRLDHFHDNSESPHQDYYDYGFIGQVGYLVTENIEPFARYDYLYQSSRPGAPNSAAGFHGITHEISLGANYYIHGHAAKITVDGSYMPNGDAIGDPSGDMLANRRGMFVVRAQFQLLI